MVMMGGGSGGATGGKGGGGGTTGLRATDDLEVLLCSVSARRSSRRLIMSELSSVAVSLSVCKDMSRVVIVSV